jgi:regulator of sirC expression with transglutaminase-like and TPR domain
MMTIAFLILVLCVPSLTYAVSDKDKIQILTNLIAQPEEQINLPRSKLIIDKLVDPSVDVEVTMARLNQMVAKIEAFAGNSASEDQKIAAIRTYLYKPGPWNDNKAFSYNMNDPLGTYIPSKLLSNYLDNRLGNCVSMPFLFIALADKMGLNVTASTAPHHVFVKYTNERGKTINLETTSGANPARDAWIRKNMPMTDLAVQNGLYLKTLSKRETLVVMAMTFVEHLMQEGRYGSVLDVSPMLVAHAPNNPDVHLSYGSAAYHILKRNFIDKYRNPDDIPPQHRGFYEHLTRINEGAFKHVERLGWKPEEKAT